MWGGGGGGGVGFAFRQIRKLMLTFLFYSFSIMVEELARWKAALSQKAIDLQDVVQRLLEERCKVRYSLMDCHRCV